jgi:uncharacterized protein (UPF0332 family)
MLQRGKQFVKHAGLRSAIHKDLVKPGDLAPQWGKVFDRAFETRQEADYLILFSFPPEQVEKIGSSGSVVETVLVDTFFFSCIR